MTPRSYTKLLGLLVSTCIYADAQASQAADATTAAASLEATDNDNSSAFKRAVEAATKRDQARTYWRAFQQSGDDADLMRSLEFLAAATALAPESTATWQLAARIYYANRVIPAFKIEAINSLEKLLQLDDSDLSSRVLLVDELMSVSAWRRAAVHLEAMFSVNPYIAADTVLDRMVICYLKSGWHDRGATFFREQIALADIKEPLMISLAIMEHGAGDTEAALSSLGNVLFSTAATKPMRAKARQLKNFWQENNGTPDTEASR